jgi:hypothetical protein
MTRMKLIPLGPPASPYAPKGRRGVPVPQDLAEHRPILPYDDGSEFAGQLGDVYRAAGALVHDPLRDLALAIEGLSYEQKRQVAAGLRTSVTRLTAWADLVIEARS